MNYLLLLVRSLLVLVLLAAQLAAAADHPDITIDGGPAVLRDNVRQYLSIADENCAAPDWRLKALLNDAQTEIENASQAVGFYQVKFTSDLTYQNNCWQLRINLVPGPAVKVQNIDIVFNGDGKDDDSFQQIKSAPGITLGERLNHGTYEDLKNRITNLATSRGYFDGRFASSVIRVDVENNSASIELVYNTGDRYRIGDINMNHKILSEKFLRRYLNIKPGDYYSEEKLLELKTLYNASNYFAVATASPDLQHLADDKVTIDVLLEERKRYAYSVGAGAATDTGARLLLGFEDRYLNDEGHSIAADFSYSRVKETAQVAYTIPMARPSYEFVKIYTGYDNETTDTSYSNKNTYGTSYSYYQHNHWLETYALNIEDEESCVACEVPDNSHLLIPSLTFSRTESDGNIAYPLRGWTLLARVSGSPQTLGSDLSFEQFYLRGKYIYPFSGGRFLLRTEFGATDIGDVNLLPASLRFFAGGDNSVRGYDYKSLGPTGIDKKTGKEIIIGGNNLLVNSIEYDYRFKPNWAAAVFYDVGNAADDLHLSFKSGVGVGIRFISPIGPIRLDIARGLDDPKGWNFHISMGPDL